VRRNRQATEKEYVYPPRSRPPGALGRSSQGALEAQNCGACAWLAAATRRSRGCLSIPAQPSSAAAPALMSTNYADNANATLA
jgi:hypothetical protein